jgi:hypothetical protein
MEMAREKPGSGAGDIGENDANSGYHHSSEGGVDDGTKPVSSQMREASS